jgi:hypothetical protein
MFSREIGIMNDKANHSTAVFQLDAFMLMQPNSSDFNSVIFTLCVADVNRG